MNWFLELLYPRDITCVLCHEESNDELCYKCLGSIQFNIGPICLGCGRMIVNSDYLMCQQCKSLNRYFDRGISVVVYDDFVKKMIFDLKYHGKKYIAHTMAKYMVRYIIKQDFHQTFDWIVPVPLHRKRLKTRGFNQAQLIGKYISMFTSIPMNDTLYRIKDTKPLNPLSFDERIELLTDAFELKTFIRGNILLIDDIFTTGATLNACAKLLKLKGADYVLAVSFAVGK